MSATDYAAVTGGTLALLGILAGVWRVGRALYRIENLARELAPNGGGSIKDAVHRLETKYDDDRAETKQILGDHALRLARAEGRIEAIALVTSPTMLIEDEEGVIREAREKGRHT